MTLTHTPEDRALVEAQVGRPMRGGFGVARRCHLGVPMVIENDPMLADGSPFPTLFWLTCPMLVKRVSRIEARGHMEEVNKRLGRDEGMRTRLIYAIERLRSRRDEHAVIVDSGAPPGGGPDKVKCLHSHVAQELSQGVNPVGAVTLAETGWPDCMEPCYSLSPPKSTLEEGRR